MINLDFTFVIQIINFLVLVLVLNTFLYKPIRKVMADRKTEMDNASSRAAQVDADVQEKMAAYESRLRDVRAQASEQRNLLKKEAAVEESSIMEQARKEATDVLGGIKEKVAKEAADARGILQEQARSLSLEICEKVLGRTV